MRGMGFSLTRYLRHKKAKHRLKPNLNSHSYFPQSGGSCQPVPQGPVARWRLIRHKPLGKVCALIALCAISLRADGFGVFDFGPYGCGPSPSGGGFAIDETEGHQLFEGEVDALFAYVAIEEGPDLDPG